MLTITIKVNTVYMLDLWMFTGFSISPYKWSTEKEPLEKQRLERETFTDVGFSSHGFNRRLSSVWRLSSYSRRQMQN